MTISPHMRYDCFNCDLSFDEHENGMCPHCHSTDFVDKGEETTEWDENENSIILKNCPFCNGRPTETADNGMEMCIECDTCGASIYKHHGDGKDYIKRCRIAWNGRFDGPTN